MNPFGTDDDDIELNYILDRHIQASFLLVNQVHEQDPPLRKDKFYKSQIYYVPHTNMSVKIREHPPKLHAVVEIVNPEDAKFYGKEAMPNKALENLTETKKK